MKLFGILPIALSLAGCVSSPPRAPGIDYEYERAECARLGGRFEVQRREVFCHLPNGETLDELDLIIGE